MKITHVVSYFSEELKYQEYYLIMEQLKMNFQVQVICSNRIISKGSFKIKLAKKNISRIVDSGVYNYNNNLQVVRKKCWFEIGGRTALLDFTDDLERFKPDIILVHGIIQFFSPIVLRFKSRFPLTKIIFDEHNLINSYQNSKFKLLLFEPFLLLYRKKIEKESFKIVGIADSSIDVIRNYYKILSNNVEMIPLGVDTNFFVPDINKRIDFRNRFNLKENDVVIAFTGKISRKKRVTLILESLENEKRSDIQIFFIGEVEKEYESEFFTSIEKSKLNIRYFNEFKHSDLPNVFNGVDICVWPFLQTISTIEASSCGRPVVCIDLLSERISNGNGIGVEAGNVIQLRQALLTLIEDKNIREEMGMKGRELVMNKLSWNIINLKMLGL